MAPATVLTNGDWMSRFVPSDKRTDSGIPSRSGIFSLKKGAETETPSRLTIPGPLISDGVREASSAPSTDRLDGVNRLFAMIGAPQHSRLPTSTLGSMA